MLDTDWRHRGAPDLARLNRLLAGSLEDPAPADEHQLTLWQAPTRADEAKQVAAAIQALARQGVPYGKMAVICRDSENYLAPIRYEFRLAGIPLFCDEATTAEHAAPVRLVRALLALLRRGLCTENLLAVAKTGLTGLSEEQLCALENYAYTWQLTAAQWQQPVHPVACRIRGQYPFGKGEGRTGKAAGSGRRRPGFSGGQAGRLCRPMQGAFRRRSLRRLI